MARKHSGKPWLHGASGWWCTTVDGKRKKLDKDYRVACRKLKALRSQQKREQAGGHDWLDVRFAELADEYLADSLGQKEASNLRKPPVSSSCVHFGFSEQRFASVSCGSSISPRSSGNWAKASTARRRSRTRLLKSRRVLNWAVSQDLLDMNPLTGYEKPRPRRRTRIITPEEFQSLLRCADGNFRRVLISLRLTGCRPAEVRKLIWEWVDLDRALWIIPEHKTVTRQREPRPRIIPLPDPILEPVPASGPRASRADRPRVSESSLDDPIRRTALSGRWTGFARRRGSRSRPASRSFCIRAGTPLARRTPGR